VQPGARLFRFLDLVVHHVTSPKFAIMSLAPQPPRDATPGGLFAGRSRARDRALLTTAVDLAAHAAGQWWRSSAELSSRRPGGVPAQKDPRDQRESDLRALRDQTECLDRELTSARDVRENEAGGVDQDEDVE